MPKIHYLRFPVTSPQTGKLPTCCRLVSDTADKSTTRRCNGILEMTRHNRHNGLLPTPTCYGRRTRYGLVVYVADLLWGSRQLVTDLLQDQTLQISFNSISKVSYFDTVGSLSLERVTRMWPHPRVDAMPVYP